MEESLWEEAIMDEIRPQIGDELAVLRKRKVSKAERFKRAVTNAGMPSAVISALLNITGGWRGAARGGLIGAGFGTGLGYALGRNEDTDSITVGHYVPEIDKTGETVESPIHHHPKGSKRAKEILRTIDDGSYSNISHVYPVFADTVQVGNKTTMTHTVPMLNNWLVHKKVKEGDTTTTKTYSKSSDKIIQKTIDDTKSGREFKFHKESEQKSKEETKKDIARHWKNIKGTWKDLKGNIKSIKDHSKLVNNATPKELDAIIAHQDKKLDPTYVHTRLDDEMAHVDPNK